VSIIARITTELAGDVPIVAIEGEIDASNVDEVANSLRTAVSNRNPAVVVDLTATTYIDSAGLNLLFELGHELAERQQELHLIVAPSSPIARMVAIIGLDVSQPTHATRDEALGVLGVQ
jgi:anti-anti-sigma factor